MVIYGLALMGGCMIVGTFIGRGLGSLLGINANVGGVGFAMLLLVVLGQKLLEKDQLSKAAQSGIAFWSAMYIPVVIAMCAKQNVVAALQGGPLAFISGILTVVAGFLLIKPISALGGKPSSDSTEAKKEAAE